MPELYSTNSVGLRFREAVKKIKERGKKNELKKPTKWAGKMWREKNSRTCESVAKLQKYYNFLKF